MGDWGAITSDTHESHETPMVMPDFDHVAFQYVQDASPAVSCEPVLFIPVLDASKYQDGSPIAENEVQAFHGAHSFRFCKLIMLEREVVRTLMEGYQ